MTELRVTVPDDVADRLASEAAQRGTSAEDLAADLLRRHLPSRVADDDRVAGFIGLGNSGRSDIAERSEEILRADFGA